MFERIKAKILFEKFLGRPDISLAYKKVGEDDPWFETIANRNIHYMEVKNHEN